jgi:hypothetical protein
VFGASSLFGFGNSTAQLPSRWVRRRSDMERRPERQWRSPASMGGGRAVSDGELALIVIVMSMS